MSKKKGLPNTLPKKNKSHKSNQLPKKSSKKSFPKKSAKKKASTRPTKSHSRSNSRSNSSSSAPHSVQIFSQDSKKSPKPNLITGIIHVHHRGFGFVKPQSGEGEEVFIPKPYVLGAIEGDLVEVEVALIVSEKGPEGKVVRILRRGRSEVVGTITSLHRDRESMVYMAYVSVLGDQLMQLVSSTEEWKVGDRVLIHVLDWGKKDRTSKGKILKFLGSIDDPSADILVAMSEFGFDPDFPPQVAIAAKSFGKIVKRSQIASREDLRHLECFTIDPDTAKDYDDALSLTLDDQGNYHLGIHIADVTAYVMPDSALDQEAKKRCNSTYFPGTVIPMLPHELSSHLCSLMPNVNRLAASVLVVFDRDGTMLNYRITRSVIKSRKRYTYKEAKDVLDGKKRSPYAKTLFLMVDLCHRLKRKRAERGSIEFSLPDISLRVDEQGVPQKIEVVEYDITHQLVEEFMLKANELVATHLAQLGKTLTYRIHEEPNLENMQQFAARCRTFGFPLSDEPTAEELQDLFDKARSSPFGQFIATSFIRSMKLASYSIQNVGHYGLGLSHYTHFTSPIRRYIDLIVHRVLFDHLDPNDDLKEIAEHCSEKERLSARAENSVLILKKLRLLQHIRNNDPKKVYEATVTGIKPFGLVFEVTEFMLEGFFHLSELHQDYYIYNENTNSLVGDRHGITFKSGDSIKVRPKKIDLITKEVQWEHYAKRRHS